MSRIEEASEIKMPSPGYKAAIGLMVLAFLNISMISLRADDLYREWVRTYRLDPAKTNAASKIALTSDGIVVAGTSGNAAGDLDYLVIKYNSNGDVAWTQRYDSGSGGQDSLRGLAVDSAGSVFVTGTSDTVKYSASGARLWTQPYAGRGIAVNTNFAYVTGFSTTQFATVQLTNNDTDGGIGWVRMLDPTQDEDVSAEVALSPNGNILIAGWETVGRNARGIPDNEFLFASYSASGALKWQTATNHWIGFENAQYISGLQFDKSGSAYMLGSFDGDPPFLARINPDGAVLWVNHWVNADTGYGIKVMPEQNVVCVGDGVISKFSPDGVPIWTQTYIAGPSESATMCVDVAANGEIFAAGFKFRTFLDNDLLVFRFGSDGTQLSSVTYDSPQHGSDFANAIVLDKAGNIYVTGYSTTAEGGTEFVTIKYTMPPKVQANPDGVMHLEFHSKPNQPYSIEATTNFFNWQSLSTNTADANGLIQFDDTNAPSIPYRFYRGKSSP